MTNDWFNTSAPLKTFSGQGHGFFLGVLSGRLWRYDLCVIDPVFTTIAPIGNAYTGHSICQALHLRQDSRDRVPIKDIRIEGQCTNDDT